MGRRRLQPDERAALARLLANAKFEVLPLRGLDEQLDALTAGATLAVTASPAKGLEASLEVGERLRRAGFPAFSVDCPGPVPQRRGHVSRCRVEDRQGRRVDVRITQVDDRGGVRIQPLRRSTRQRPG